MILAAGFGSRLRPLTDRVPKALVEVGGVPMLERIARRLIRAGADRLIVNVHHHADQITRFLEERDGFGVDVRVSPEPDAPLETGGGLARAAHHFRRDAPFYLHNVDIVTDVDLRALYGAHDPATTLATLAVSGRESSRLLRFDEDGLQARVDARSGAVDEARSPRGGVWDRAFAGIHVLSPAVLDALPDSGAYSIIDAYLRLSGEGHAIRPWEMGDALWLEIGDPDRLERARAEIERREAAG